MRSFHSIIPEIKFLIELLDSNIQARPNEVDCRFHSWDMIKRGQQKRKFIPQVSDWSPYPIYCIITIRELEGKCNQGKYRSSQLNKSFLIAAAFQTWLLTFFLLQSQRQGSPPGPGCWDLRPTVKTLTGLDPEIVPVVFHCPNCSSFHCHIQSPPRSSLHHTLPLCPHWAPFQNSLLWDFSGQTLHYYAVVQTYCRFSD